LSVINFHCEIVPTECYNINIYRLSPKSGAIENLNYLTKHRITKEGKTVANVFPALLLLFFLSFFLSFFFWPRLSHYSIVLFALSAVKNNDNVDRTAKGGCVFRLGGSSSEGDTSTAGNTNGIAALQDGCSPTPETHPPFAVMLTWQHCHNYILLIM
jgi:hypothetical protein